MLIKKPALPMVALVSMAMIAPWLNRAGAETTVSECKDCKTQNQPGGSLGDLAKVAGHLDPNASCLNALPPGDQGKVNEEVSRVVTSFFNGEITKDEMYRQLGGLQLRFNPKGDSAKAADINARIQTAMAKGLNLCAMPLALSYAPGKPLAPEQNKVFKALGYNDKQVGELLTNLGKPWKAHIGYLNGAEITFDPAKGWTFPKTLEAKAVGWNKPLVKALDAIGAEAGLKQGLGAAVADPTRTKLIVVGNHVILPPRKGGANQGQIEVLTREQFDGEMGKIDELAQRYLEEGKGKLSGGFFDSARKFREGEAKMAATMKEIRDWRDRMQYGYGVDEQTLKQIDDKLEATKKEYDQFRKSENTKFIVNVGITWAEGVLTAGTLNAVGGIAKLIGESGARHLAASEAAKAAGKTVARQVGTKMVTGAAMGVGLGTLRATVDAGVNAYYRGGSFACRELDSLSKAAPNILMEGVMFAALAPVGEIAGGIAKGVAGKLKLANSEAAVRAAVGSAETALLAYMGDAVARGTAIGGIECGNLISQASELASKGEDYVKAGKVETWKRCADAVEQAAMGVLMAAPHVAGQLKGGKALAAESAGGKAPVEAPAAAKADAVKLDDADRVAAKLAESVAPARRAAVQSSLRDSLAVMSTAERAQFSSKLATSNLGVSALADIAANPKAEYNSRRASIRALEQAADAKSLELIKGMANRTDDVAGSRLAALALKERAKAGDASAIELLTSIARDAKAEPRTRLIANQAVESATGKAVLKPEEIKAQINPDLQLRVKEEAAQIAQADQRMRREGMTEGERAEIRRELEDIYSRQNQQIKAEEMDKLFNQAVDECL